MTLLATTTRAARRSTRSTARAGTRGPKADLHDRERERTDLLGDRRTTRPRSPTSRARSAAAATRASRSTPRATSILEDIGGANKAGTRPRRSRTASCSATCRRRPGDLANGKLQVLQVLNNVNRQPITQTTQTPLHSPDQVALHIYGSSFDTNWVTIHDTANGHDAVQREHARQGGRRNAVQAAGERTLPSRHAASASSTSTRPATRTRRARRTRTRAAGARSSSSARAARAPRAPTVDLLPLRRDAGRLRQRRRSSRTT